MARKTSCLLNQTFAIYFHIYSVTGIEEDGLKLDRESVEAPYHNQKNRVTKSGWGQTLDSGPEWLLHLLHWP